MDDLLRFLLTTPPTPAPLASLEDWWRQHQGLASRFATPVDLALAGGFMADRLGFAFASGYHAALRSLFPRLSPDHRAALCATEAGGGHPSAIQTRLMGGEGALRLTGYKAFVTLGTAADTLFVVATEGQDEQGRNRLRLVMIDARRQGLTFSALPPPPFIPEISHAELRLDDVHVSPDEVLPGDGYTRYLKPFRTVEDCHVHAAFLGWLLQVARRSGWPESVQDEVLALAVTFRGLALADPTSAAVHVALGGALDLSQRLVGGLNEWWPRADATTRERWERDKGLLGVAGKARAKRREVARQRLTSG
ncbi:acyl-CoA dehydrogenase family protein [Hyalangium rubrum]|uniref:Acyl-CoA dehydrogenase family protein n=1 Tax=Hyalangium rubrum TaxID=3103134 RepID=A0ABU5GXN3_9BACT|nr:acyl-CoA dehydrogenase family protein [Hyalangium sp. s54d21]MDY7225637.1 acyl-CoA dehydrogenase family protein [Hyalangium sp. s54d21]